MKNLIGLLLIGMGIGIIIGTILYSVLDKKTTSASAETKVETRSVNAYGEYCPIYTGTVIQGPTRIHGLSSFDYLKIKVLHEDKEVYVILKSFAHPEDYGSILEPGTEVKFQRAYIPAVKNSEEKSFYLLIY